MIDPRYDASFDSWCLVCDRTTRHVTRKGWTHCMIHPGLVALMLATDQEAKRCACGESVAADGICESCHLDEIVAGRTRLAIRETIADHDECIADCLRHINAFTQKFER